MNALRPFGIARRRHIRRRAKVNRSTQTQEAQPASTPFSEKAQSTSAPFSEKAQSTSAPFSEKAQSTSAPFSKKAQSASAPFSENAQSASAPFSESWASKHSYKYFQEESPPDIWEKCKEVVERYDEQACTDLKDEIIFLMVVAGLFLAIVTAFTVESYKLLGEDKQDTISDLLVEVVRLLNDTSAQGHAQLPKRFTPDHRSVVVNQLWFLSMMLSLIAVLIGTFCLQWISAFLRGRNGKDKSIPPVSVLGMRHLCQKGFDGWGVRHAPEVLLLIVQLSIALFTSGLVYFLWNINRPAAVPALVVSCITGILLCIVNVMPFLQSLIGVVFPRFLTVQCPYKSPTSWLVRFVCESLALPFRQWGKRRKKRSGIVGRLAAWLESRLETREDHLSWRAHDRSFVVLRDLWGVTSIAHHEGLGISSALDILVLEPNAADIIRRSVLDLRATFNLAFNLKEFFEQALSPVVQSIFNDDKHGHGFLSTNLSHSREDQQLHFHEFLNDLTIALVLQNIVNRSIKLHHLFLWPRVELYIRLKNSMLSLFQGALTLFAEFDRSLDFPFRDTSDADQLDLGEVGSIFLRRYAELGRVVELKFQFLKYLNRIWDTEFLINPNDFLLCAQIIRIEGVGCPVSAQCPTCSSNQQTGLTAVKGGINRSRAGDPPLRAAFRDLCIRTKEWLLGLPDPFGDVEVCVVQELLKTNHA